MSSKSGVIYAARVLLCTGLIAPPASAISPRDFRDDVEALGATVEPFCRASDLQKNKVLGLLSGDPEGFVLVERFGDAYAVLMDEYSSAERCEFPAPRAAERPTKPTRALDSMQSARLGELTRLLADSATVPGTEIDSFKDVLLAAPPEQAIPLYADLLASPSAELVHRGLRWLSEEELKWDTSVYSAQLGGVLEVRERMLKLIGDEQSPMRVDAAMWLAGVPELDTQTGQALDIACTASSDWQLHAVPLYRQVRNGELVGDGRQRLAAALSGSSDELAAIAASIVGQLKRPPSALLPALVARLRDRASSRESYTRAIVRYGHEAYPYLGQLVGIDGGTLADIRLATRRYRWERWRSGAPVDEKYQLNVPGDASSGPERHAEPTPAAAAASPTPAAPAFSALVDSGKLRVSTATDFAAMRAVVATMRRKGRATISDSAITRFERGMASYTILSDMLYPDSGEVPTVLLLPIGVATPAGDPGSTVVFDLTSGTCSGSLCRD